MPQTRSRAPFGPLLVGVAALLLLATCAEPIDPGYTQRHPIGVEPETVSVPASYAGTPDPFAGAGEQRFDTLVQGYLDGGHGPLTIAGSAPSQRAAGVTAARMAALRRRLEAAGVPGSMIRMQVAADGEPDTITLSYEHYIAVLPTCGDWSVPMDFNPDNRDYPGFGCAQQRNLGAMVADPADLASMHQDQASDPLTSGRVTGLFRGGSTPVPDGTSKTERPQNTIETNQDQNAATGTSFGSTTSTR